MDNSECQAAFQTKSEFTATFNNAPKEAQKLVIDMAEFIGDRALMQHGIDAHAELIESLYDLFNETSYTIKKA